MAAITVKELLHEVKIDGLYDGYGVCMAWLFAIADYLTFELDHYAPGEWEFCPSPFGADSKSYEYETLQELKPTIETLEKVGAILWRYRAKLIQAGKDY